jgi:hypothetical protein
MTAVTPVHQEMSQRAEQQQKIRKCTEDVRPVLLPKKERRDRKKDAESH